jgi:hypothetical protein
MTFLGKLFGYNQLGNDLLGFPQDNESACLVCGKAVNAHTEEMNIACQQAIYRREW